MEDQAPIGKVQGLRQDLLDMSVEATRLGGEVRRLQAILTQRDNQHATQAAITQAAQERADHQHASLLGLLTNAYAVNTAENDRVHALLARYLPHPPA
jgi:hypothetical protein